MEGRFSPRKREDSDHASDEFHILRQFVSRVSELPKKYQEISQEYNIIYDDKLLVKLKTLSKAIFDEHSKTVPNEYKKIIRI